MLWKSLRQPALSSWCLLLYTVPRSQGLSTMSGGVWDDQKDRAIANCILPLSKTSHKGSSGRIGILGGSVQYTGAPYYSGISALKAGADLVHVFCAEEAAIAIKSYSPELMVQAVYSGKTFAQGGSEKTVEEIKHMVDSVSSMLERLHCLVIGPGLGRNECVFEAVKQIAANAMKLNLFLVLDADALFLLSQDPCIIKDYAKVVLTPNAVEYKRLFEHNNDNVASALSQATILQKGHQDQIFRGNPPESLRHTCREPGGLKRSGGIGDVLSGTVATLVGWQEIMEKKSCDNSYCLALSCWTAACIVKRATQKAFHLHHRAMSAEDVIQQLGPAMFEMTEQ